MKFTGIVRKIDILGRLVLPMELRRTMGIKEGDLMEIYVDGDQIVLKKYRASANTVACCLCNSAAGLINGYPDFKGKILCRECAEKLGV